MPHSEQATTQLSCSFCSKRQPEVRKLIAGHGGVAICDECLDVCNDLVADSLHRPSTRDEGERVSWDESEPADAPRLFSFKCPECGHRWKMANRS